MKVATLVVAAGRGRRFGGPLPKQYQDLHGRPVLRHSLATFTAHPDIHAVTAVIHPDDMDLYQQAATGLTSLRPPVFGGAERQDSVRLGLESLAGQGFDAVLIHDGARPFVSWETISQIVQALESAPGAIPALEVSDTLKRASVEGLIGETVPRQGLWRAQTPQGFHFQPILDAHRQCRQLALTDDAAVAEQAGLEVRVVRDSPRNIKVTLEEDLKRLALPSLVPVVGSGFDVHSFTLDKKSVTLCGVSLPHSCGLLGHSDADVAMHALTDALYGCVAAGDIGRFFPPGQSQWKDCPSRVFLEHARSLLEALGGKIQNVDLTIICEAPKVGPHRRAMMQSLASLLGLPLHRVSVKATTTEGLGFTGRREGIAAQATVLALLPETL